MRYSISLTGCDDMTTFEIDLDDHEAAAVRRIAAVSKETSSYGCMPVLAIAAAPLPEIPDTHPKENA